MQGLQKLSKKSFAEKIMAIRLAVRLFVVPLSPTIPTMGSIALAYGKGPDIYQF